MGVRGIVAVHASQSREGIGEPVVRCGKGLSHTLARARDGETRARPCLMHVNVQDAIARARYKRLGKDDGGPHSRFRAQNEVPIVLYEPILVIGAPEQ